ncbi:GntR family transcriptional regulator [Micromonospora sp. NPDC018662]|uniref:GntR family transcriptional regulator n=1 Tax=Micromonospora sp. NPDC018662 TaxID=3364238 RepID=UPI0037A98B51
MSASHLRPHSRQIAHATRELAETYGVHINTAYRAMSLLHDRELITGQPGRGTYVAEPPAR